MEDATYWTAFGSVATAVGSFLALATIGTTLLQSRKQQRAEQAARLRQDIRAFVNAAHHLQSALLDGGALIAAAWAARGVLVESLPAQASADQVRKVLKDKQVNLTMAVVGWERAPEAAALRDQIAALNEASRHLGGLLQVLAQCGHMLRDVAEQLRIDFMELLENDLMLALFLREQHAETDPVALLNALSRHLFSTVATLVARRYQAPLKTLDTLITALAATLSSLDADALLTLSRAPVPYTPLTRTGTMLALLKDIAAHWDEEQTRQVQALIAQLESELNTPPAPHKDQAAAP